ncbi:MAG: ScnB-like protein [Rhodobacterales bacterium]
MGGFPAGQIDKAQHDFAIWEKRVDALLSLSTKKKLFTVDGLRRALEDMGADAFEKMTYYERWIAAINQNLIESGIYSIEELGSKMTEVKKRGETYGAAQKGKP